MSYNGNITTKYLEDFYTYFVVNKGNNSGEPLIQTNVSELKGQKNKMRADGEVISGNQDPSGNFGNSTVAHKTPGSVFKEVDTNAFLKDLGVPLNVKAPAPPPETGHEGAKVWGDPHFETKEGDKFDVQGKPGHAYNIWEDSKGRLSLNALFVAGGPNAQPGTTVMGAIQINTPDAEIKFGKGDKPPIVNGVPVEPGQTVRQGGTTISVSKDGKDIRVITDDGYDLSFKRIEGRIDFNVNNAPRDLDKDGKSRHGGLLGQVYGDGKASVGKGEQGQGVIKGNPEDYEVSKFDVE